MLYFSIHLPTKKVPQAGHKICHNHLKNLSKNHQVHLLSQVNQAEQKHKSETDFSFCASYRFIDITNRDRFLNFLAHPLLPFRVAIRCNKKTIQEIQSILADNDISEVFIEYEQGAFVLPFVGGNVRKTVVFHDVLSQYVQRKINFEKKYSLLRFLYYLELIHTKHWERKLLKTVDKAIVFSEKDKSLLVEMGGDPLRIQVEHPYVDEMFYNIKRDRCDPFTILFWGALDRAVNEDGMLWFLKQVYPLVIEKIPNLRLIILGANPSKNLLKFASHNISIPGFVADPIPYFEKASLAIAPIKVGAGIKIKVLEFMAANIFTVCTSVAVEGITFDYNQLAVADTEHEFAHHIITKLNVNNESARVNQNPVA